MASEKLSLPTPDRLLELIDAMAGQPVVMLADLVADRFIRGVPARISREAPVLILSYDGETLTPGGGANAVFNVAALGGRPLPIGIVGDDASGDELRRIFAAHDIPLDGIVTRPGFRTPTKTRIVAGPRHGIKQQIVRYDVEDTAELSEAELLGRLEQLRGAAGGARVAVLSDYGYGAVDPRLVPGIRRTLGSEVTILGDSRYRLGELSGLDGVTPNSEEAMALLGRPFEGDRAEIENGGRELLDRLACRFLLITRGSAGMSLFAAEPGPESGLAHLPVHGTSQVADVTGAGDTVIGTFALALAAGGRPLEAACLANYAGGVVVMKMGTATLGPDELRVAVTSDPQLLQGIHRTAWR
ncbi:MAG: bifunctional ADP-heptose synthase [Thermoanaerobaculia bacterium]